MQNRRARSAVPSLRTKTTPQLWEVHIRSMSARSAITRESLSRLSTVLASCLADHLRTVTQEIQQVSVTNTYKPLLDATCQMLVSVADACDVYFIDVDNKVLNDTLLLTVMDFTQRWELWIATQRFSPEKTLHEFLLRFSKGAIKSWRIYRIDSHK